MTTAYYNEFDPYAAQWLENLMASGHIMPGKVDRRSIHEVGANDLVGATRAHFFAGIAGWDLALQLAGWPAERPVWTGSCPCQPFSAAGKRKGNLDARHLWPDFYALVRARMPPTIFGEQVASADGRLWLNGVRSDLEAVGYAFGAADLCAAGVGAPHIRQRLYWVAYTGSHRRNQQCGDAGRAAETRKQGWNESVNGGSHGWLGNASGPGLPLSKPQALQRAGWREEGRAASQPGCAILGMEHAESIGREQWRPKPSQWGAEFRRGADGKIRRLKPGLEPLAHGVPGRVGKLRAYGNAIVPQVAAEFISAFMETLPANPNPPSQERP